MTAEEIQAVAATVFRADNRVVLTYVPEGTTEDDVALSPEDAEAGETDAEVAA